jgi:hypothetical protein
MLTQALRSKGFIHAVSQSPMDMSRVVFVPWPKNTLNHGMYDGGEGVYVSEGERFPSTEVLAWKYDE